MIIERNWSQRLDQWAVEHPLIYLLIRERPFRWALSLVVLILVALPATLYPWIRSTPETKSPVILISAVDRIQSIALARKARRYREEGKRTHAVQAWSMAIGNDPGNLPLNREFLSMLLVEDDTQTHWRDAVRTGLWILRISDEVNDLILACETFSAYGLNELVLEAIKRHPPLDPEPLNRLHLLALYDLGEPEKFKALWSACKESIKSVPELRARKLAFDAIGSDPELARKSREELDELLPSLRDPGTRQRLGLASAFSQRNRARFEEILGHLQRDFTDELEDHLLHWKLLLELGRHEDARKQALDFNSPPRTSLQIIKLANAYTDLGLTQLALEYLSHYTLAFGFNSWQIHTQARLLIDSQDWEALQRFALKIRTLPNVSREFMALSFYFEGKALRELGRPEQASKSFGKVRHEDLLGSPHALYVGTNLAAVGELQSAMEILWPEQDRFRHDPSFWNFMLKLAYDLRTGSRLLIAAENLFRLDPENHHYRASYASVLLSERIQIDRALALTYEQLSANPGHPNLKINYAQALVMNDRLEAAAQILNHVNPDRLNQSERQGLLFSQMELHFKQGHDEAARTQSRQIIPGLLLPGDQKYFRTIQRALKERAPPEESHGTFVEETP